MQTAEDLFRDAFQRFLKSWSTIHSLREVVAAGQPSAEKALTSQNEDFWDALRNHSRFKTLFVNEELLNGETRDEVALGMAQSTIKKADVAMDAASIVLLHSILDDYAWSCLKTCAIVHPENWEKSIEGKQVDFRSLRDKDYLVIRDELIEKELKLLDGESLLGKFDLLHRLCSPRLGFAPVKNYIFDRDRLKRINKSRNDIIHNTGFSTSLPNVSDDMEYIGITAFYLKALVVKECRFA